MVAAMIAMVVAMVVAMVLAMEEGRRVAPGRQGPGA